MAAVSGPNIHPSARIHPSSVIDPAAVIDEDVEIGPFCVVGAEVHIGARTRLMANLYIEGPTWIGKDNLFYPFSTIGVASQDLKYKGERSETRIGNRNRIREYVTIHRGTEGGGLVTRIGDDNQLMVSSHIAHDADIGSHCLLGNGVTLAGHVTIGDWAVISAFTGIHQFCRIGKHSMIGGYSVVTQDVIPYSTTVSEREIRVFGANRVGLERRGFSADAIEPLQNLFRLLTRSKLNTSQAVDRIREEIPQTEEVLEVLDFVATSSRGFIK